ncbi:hypothetical protein ANCCEY_07745 [Ancylostoma ceylanicum]|uniref:LITAF domain-containing protein n=2 Tax=Ancylostoma ceylanicum TaxID=53326 RepID=A0A8I3B1S0_9BILA|nr:hypothetical protein ANCCEY_07745 [Ancylostoma ceylanicum]EYC11139.1 hypothetical protein Y032_0052g2244 [Ancylostoma ceylanicum]
MSNPQATTSIAPPSYNEALSAPSAPPPSQPSAPKATVPPTPQPQVVYGQGGVTYTVHPQPIVVSPAVIIIKDAHTFHPYPEYCPRCQTIVTTRRVWVSGSCACTVLILALCIPFLWPMLFFLCTPAFKDAHHYCPHCLTLLSIRRR